MKIGIVGPSYQERSLPFDAQRSVNLYAVYDKMGKEAAAMYGTPGLALFGTAGVGPIRGEFFSSNGRAFVVSGSKLYEIDTAGTATELGSLNQSSGAVTMAENTVQLAICDGSVLYTLVYSSNTFAEVVDADLPSAATVISLDSYFIVNQINAGTFYISNLNDGNNWEALDFSTAESSPDTLERVFTTVGQLWLLGKYTTEIWTNTGDSDFPFERVSNTKIESGILAPNSATEINNNLFWIGSEKRGNGIVYVASGFAPQRVSTHAIEQAIGRATDKANIRGYSYQEAGHTFYVLTDGGLETTLVYDLSTKLWHERSYLNAEGTHEQHLGSTYMYAFGKHILGSRLDGSLYEMKDDYFDDAGDAILRERIYTHLLDEDKRLRYNRLVIGFETGTGVQTGQGSDPLVSLQLSKDGARTWSDSFTAAIGKVGEYKTKVVFRRLGIAEQMTFRLKISEPVKIAITGSYLT